MTAVLPLDPEEMNEQRASAAKRALLYFARDFGETDDCGDLAEFSEQNLSDLLVDLAHYCDREGLSFLECFLRASRCYAEETDDSGMQFERRGKLSMAPLPRGPKYAGLYSFLRKRAARFPG